MSLNLFFDIPKEKPDEELTDYFVHCYLYYKLDTPVIYDYDFDLLCKSLLDRWDSITHSYKELISKDNLKAGTGFSITYPPEIIEEAERRKKIFLQELEHEVEVAREIDRDQPLVFSHSPTETYLLCGMLKEFIFYRDQKKEQVNVELQKRMSEDIHHSEIEKYLSDHKITLSDLNLID